MIEIKEVKTKKQKKLFVDFPTKLYKDNKLYVHPLRMDEMVLFGKKNSSYDDVEMIYFLAYKDGEVAGRICGVLQRLYNQKNNTKRVRFVRFDVINDQEVCNALLNAVETWAKQKGMTEIHGPLGFNDVDREGLLIEGFDQLANFEENYNFPYYQTLLENYGYEKEIDWIGRKLFTPKKLNERLDRLAEVVLKRYKLHIIHEKKSKFLKKYKQQIFDVLDEAYEPLYGVTPYTQPIRKQLLNQVRLYLDMRLFIAVADENDRVIAFGFAFPSLARAVQKCKGKLFPTGFVGLLKSLKDFSILDLCLVGIRPEWQGKGVNAIIMRFLQQTMIDENVQYCETNHCLEDNIKIAQQWELFDHVCHKRFRCFVKKLDEVK